MKLEGNKGDTRRHWSRKSSVDIIKHIVYSIKFSKNRLLEERAETQSSDGMVLRKASEQRHFSSSKQ